MEEHQKINDIAGHQSLTAVIKVTSVSHCTMGGSDQLGMR
jgi:hypothetical protein